MIFHANAFRRTAAGVSLILAALVLPTAAQAATTQTSASVAAGTWVSQGPYPSLSLCTAAASAYGPNAYCYQRYGRWYLMVWK
ncbi:hypothetical protein [Streptosporangium sp. NPDC000396]|uniref:hypothetical protein n=1 Tax=Streptosporangium sp. NPDC000396 TaxID=3366185 RepID=UPI0036B12AC6